MKTPVNILVSSEMLNGQYEEKAEVLNLIYRNENLCIEAFRKFKLQFRIQCKKCDTKDFLQSVSFSQFKCKTCGHTSGLRAGTVLEGVNLPVSYLFRVVHVLLKYSNVVTVSQLQLITGSDDLMALSGLLEKIRMNMTIEEQAVLLVHFVEGQESNKEYLF